jgi:undecaprenyl pyrophosphate phosphatase UppP
MKERLVFVITTMVSITLCFVVLSMVGVLLTGLFYKEVDNNKIFELIGPAFQMIIGGFIGLLAGIKINEPEKRKSCSCETEVE